RDEHLRSEVDDATFGGTGWNQIPSAARTLRRGEPQFVTNRLRPLAMCQALAGFRERAAFQPHDKIDHIPVLGTGEAMEVRVAGITHVHAEARGPLLVERTQRPVPARSTAAQRDPVG